MNLRHAAFRLRCEIERILATTPPTEAPGRIEDILFAALTDLADGVRRAVRREYAGE
jgi:hypothetical protein